MATHLNIGSPRKHTSVATIERASIAVVLADDHLVMRRSLRTLLDGAGGRRSSGCHRRPA